MGYDAAIARDEMLSRVCHAIFGAMLREWAERTHRPTCDAYLPAMENETKGKRPPLFFWHDHEQIFFNLHRIGVCREAEPK